MRKIKEKELDAEAWHDSLEGNSAYQKLLSYRQLRVKRMRICGRSQRWWNEELQTQLKNVRVGGLQRSQLYLL